MKVELKKSTLKDKKFMIEWEENGKLYRTHFGGAGYLDFILSGGNEEKKKAYIARHSGENWSDWRTAGTLSRYLLWNKKTLRDSVLDFEKRFGIKILMK